MEQPPKDSSQLAGGAPGLDPRRAGPSILAFGRITLALAIVGLGVLGLVVGDFALQWQPAPEGMPARRLLAYLAAGLSVAIGAGLLIPRLRAASAAAACVAFFAWTLALHGPKVLAAPLDILPWLAFCEILAVAAGALMLTAESFPGAPVSRFGPPVGRLLFGACLPVFGASHFAYLQFTAEMIPAFVPAPLFWAWFTGAAHIAAGVAILTGALARLASLLFAVMVSGFVLLLHVPRVIAEPASRQEWTMLAMASVITAAAWCAAGVIARGPAWPGRRPQPDRGHAPATEPS